MFDSRFMRFDSGTRAVTARGDETEFAGVDGGAPVVLARRDHDLAKLFDGRRNAHERLVAARELGLALDADALEGFAAELSLTGLLHAGSHEPLPVPAQSDEEARQLGWRGGPRTMPRTADAACLPPSTVPGSRNNPGLSGGLAGLVTGKRGQANQIHVPLPTSPFAWLGRLLVWPTTNRATLLAFGVLLAACGGAVIRHRHEWLTHMYSLWGGFRFIPAVMLGGLLVNVFATAARAASIARYTPERARLGIVFGIIGMPRLFVDTSGAAERASRADRIRIAGSGMVGGCAVLAMAVLGWFLTATSMPTLAHYCSIIAPVAAAVVLVRLNPIGQQDGYFVLANAINQLDLRLQAMTVLYGYERPWMTQSRRIPHSTLLAFFALVVLYWILLLVVVFTFAGDWLTLHLGGIGFLILVGLVGAYVVRMYLRTDSIRSNMGRSDGGWKSWIPGRNARIAIGVVLVACLVPYPYDPGGDFVVLPRDRADVRALAEGDVREVLVKEGDLVQAGQPIARLDDAGARARLVAAQSMLAGHRANLALAKKGARSEELDVARQQVATARTMHDIAVQHAQRIEAAYKGKAVPASELDRARGAVDTSAQVLLQSQRSYESVAGPVRDERIRELESAVASAQALVDLRQREAAYTTLLAPIAGRVVSQRLAFARGTFLARGDLLAQIEDAGERLAEIRLPESSVRDVRVENAAWARAWAYPGTSFEGKVKTIAPAVDQAWEGRVVRVQMVVSDPDNRLKSGMTGNAKVDAGWHPAGLVFTRAVARFLLVTIWSWIP